MSDIALMRLGILVIGLVAIAVIWYIGRRPRTSSQGRRVRGGETPSKERREPTLGAQIEQELAESGPAPAEESVQAEMELFNEAAAPAPAASGTGLGRRVSDEFDKIVTLYIAARANQVLRGPDIVVAAEKAGLTYGHMNVFHRLIEGYPERGPIFSVANIRKPGSFEMAEIQSLETPAIAFFLTLPAPVSALDAWEAMEPTAQRMTELLDGVLLDEQRNALSRQRIAHIRDELRAYDREHEVPPLTRSPRW